MAALLVVLAVAGLHINGLSSIVVSSRGPAGCLADLERSTTGLFQQVSPSVVQVVAFSAVGEHSKLETRMGSGFAWDRFGHIVTNEHVVRGASVIVIWLASGERAEAEISGTARNHDLAVVRLKSAGPLPPPVRIGRSEDLKVGQFAYAIGSPFGLDQSLTTGVISALRRELPTEDGGVIPQVIQTDAAIYPGNSGGPLLDSAGRLIGVNTISYSVAESQGALGFAIPVELVKRVVPELINGRSVP
jgi:2-alkenal reductase